jgi:hypothetical protein
MRSRGSQLGASGAVKTPDELRDEAARMREFLPWVRDEAARAEVEAMIETYERLASEQEKPR